MPTVMKVVESSSEDSDEARGFLANTMGLIKTKDQESKASKISNDLDALFGKLI